MKADVQQKILEAVARDRLPMREARVMVAVSGGADSLALLHAMLALREELGIAELATLHIHHGIRGEEATRDANTVRHLCEQWGVPCFPYQVDVPQEARRRHKGLEETARRLRYDIYKQWTDRGWLVLTGHTRSDTAETVLLHITRGCGVSGLEGILPLRDGVARPLLGCSREQTEQYCRAHGIPYVMDCTNEDVRYARNRIRREVLPSLKAINPQVEEAIVRLSQLAGEETAFLRECAEALWRQADDGERGLNRAVLRNASPFLAKAVLRRAFPAYDMEQKHWEALYRLVQDIGAVTLPHGVTVRSSKTHIIKEELLPLPPPFCRPVEVGDTISWCEAEYLVSVISYQDFLNKEKIHKKLFSFALSYDIIKGGLYVRQRKDGDRYHPTGRCGKTLKQLMNEAKWTPYQRASAPILCDEEGILWVPEFGCDERARIGTETKTVLVLLLQEKSVVSAVWKNEREEIL